MSEEDAPILGEPPAEASPISSDDPEHALSRIRALLDRIAGQAGGDALLDRLLQTDEPIASVVRDLANSPGFARLFKEVRTLSIGANGLKEPDPEYVGVENLDRSLPFEVQFDRFFRPLLDARAEGFAAIFEAVISRHARPLIVETGCLRVPGNWAGDGQSTFMFDALVRDSHGTLISIDIAPESIDSARRACSSMTHLVCNDSVATLHALSGLLRQPVSLLYLDSFDLDHADPMPSAIHHLMELTAARPLLGPDTIVCVDDYGVGSPNGGKGLLVDTLLARLNQRVLFSGYQKAWLFE